VRLEWVVKLSIEARLNQVDNLVVIEVALFLDYRDIGRQVKRQVKCLGGSVLFFSDLGDAHMVEFRHQLLHIGLFAHLECRILDAPLRLSLLLLVTGVGP
jgi:hypothetical protein